MNNWTIIFRDGVPGVAGVVVYDKGRSDILGRYVIAKAMKLPNGRTRTAQTYYEQRPAALRYARGFLNERAAKFSTNYEPGAGEKTCMFKPVLPLAITAVRRTSRPAEALAILTPETTPKAGITATSAGPS